MKQRKDIWKEKYILFELILQLNCRKSTKIILLPMTNRSEPYTGLPKFHATVTIKERFTSRHFLKLLTTAFPDP